MPSSLAPLHDHRTTHQRFVYLVTRSCCLPNLGAPPSLYARAPLPETNLCSQSQHFTKSPCTLAQWAGAHLSHLRTRAKSSHKPGTPPFHRRARPHKSGATHPCTPSPNHWALLPAPSPTTELSVPSPCNQAQELAHTNLRLPLLSSTH